MKHVGKADTPVTQKELSETLQESLKSTESKLDLQFSKRLDKSFEAFWQENKFQLKMMEERWDRKFLAFENRILTAIDPLIKDMETRQQEREIAAAQVKHTQDDITDLQKRVTKLEQTN